MIRHLVLENWKSHSRSEFEFGKGTNVIVGVMGSGKSAVMDAVCFALYGTFPALNNRKVSLDEVIMNKPVEQEQARVVLEFDYAGKEYKVERTINRRGQNHGKVYEGTRLIAGPKMTDVTKRIEEVLEVDFELFSRAIYSEQNNIDYFLRLTPSQRKEKMDELLQLDRYEKARANSVLVGNRLRKAAEERDRWLNAQKQEIEGADYKGLKKRLGEREGERRDAEARHKGLEAEIRAKEVALEKMKRAEEKFRALNAELIALGGRAETLEKMVYSASKHESGDVIEKEVKENRAQAKALEARVKELEAERKKCNEEVRTLSGKIWAGDSKIKELEEATERLRAVKAKCPVCRSALSEGGKKELLRENADALDALGKEKGALEAELKTWRAQDAKNERDREKAEKELHVLLERHARLEAALEQLGKLDAQKKELAKVCTDEKETAARIKALAFDEREFEQAKREVTQTSSAIRAMAQELRQRAELIEETKRGMERVEGMIRRLGEMEEEAAIIRGSASKLAVFTNALMAAQAELRAVLIDAVNSAMDDVWARVYPYGDYTGAKLEVSGDSYEIVVRERSGKWIRAEGILSGGERSAVALTIRIAVSLILARNLSWMILDEPTHNLDANAVKMLGEMMKGHMPQMVEQVFIITHDKAMENAASSNLYRLERDKSGDGATAVVVESVS